MIGFVFAKILDLLKSTDFQSLGIQYPDWFVNKQEIWYTYGNDNYKITIEKLENK